MKRFLPSLFILFSTGIFAQQKTILLRDGGVLVGEIVRMDSVTGQAVVMLSDSTEIELPAALILKAKSHAPTSFVFKNGSKLLKKGRYSLLSVYSLTGKTEVFFEEKTRWDFGASFGTGYQFNQFLALGGSIGLDGNDDMLMPIAVELRGYLVNTIGFNMNGRLSQDYSYRCPLTYSLQFGYNLPTASFFSKDETTNYKGGRLFYPSLGIQFPTQSGVSILIDFGYKIQRYSRERPDFWGNSATDSFTLRSFAMRVGVGF